MIPDSLRFRLFVNKDERVSSTDKLVTVWSTNSTNAIDNLFANLNDTDAALMIIDMIAGDLNGDTNVRLKVFVK